MTPCSPQANLEDEWWREIAGIASDLGDNQKVWEFRGEELVRGHRAMLCSP